MFGISDGASVVVIGAGITGLSAAHRLGETGISDVVLVDPSGFGSGATGIQPGGVRQQWGSRVNCLLARESIGFYAELEERLGAPVGATLQSGGYLFLAERQESLDALAHNRRVQEEAGVPSTLLTPDEVADLVPGIDTTTVLGGSFCAEDGYFDNPQAVVAGIAAAATRLGARLRTERVEALAPREGGWRVSLAGGGGVDADAVVVAAGAETVSLLSPLGLEIPIRKEARHLFYSDPIRERLLDPLVVAVDRHFASKQLADGTVLASDLSASGDPAVDLDSWLKRVREGIRALLPALEFVAFPVHVTGDYDITPDRQMIVGRISEAPGLIVAAGMNGRGFMMAPAVGRLVAEAVAGAPADAVADALSPSRFNGASLALESQVV